METKKVSYEDLASEVRVNSEVLFRAVVVGMFIVGLNILCWVALLER